MRYAISDIHGCLQTFKDLLKQLNFSKQDTLYLLGDYIDRGPDSKGVIDYIWEMQRSGYEVYCLKGNHEQMMVESSYNLPTQSAWLRYGGWETIGSFDVTRMADVPQEYLEWMHQLPHYLEVDNYLLVHAGLDFSSGDPMDDEEGMLWARGWYKYIDRDWMGEQIVIHGHTPISEEMVRIGLRGVYYIPAINIDNGCVYDRDGMGQLCAYNMDSKELHFLKRSDRKETML